jgi:translation initiation factor IF-2
MSEDNVVKKIVDMAANSVSIKQFADEIGVKPDRLLDQFKDAGIPVAGIGDNVTEEQKQQLLRYLQQHHGAKQEERQERIILRRAKTSEIKVGSSHGTKKTVSIQVRKKRTYVKRLIGEDSKNKLEDSELEPAGGDVSLEVGLLTIEESLEAKPDTAKVSVEAEEKGALPIADAKALAEQQVSPAVAPTAPSEQKTTEIPRRKEKHRVVDEAEADSERHSKKKKSRDSSRDNDRHIEVLLGRGVNLNAVLKRDDEDDETFERRKMAKTRANAYSKIQVQAFTKPTTRVVYEVIVPDTIQLTELAQRMSVKATEVIKVMMRMGIMVGINHVLDQETAVLVVEEMGHQAKPVSSNAIEAELIKSVQTTDSALLTRPPVITIMGHVDHGKTTLLDYIRTTKVAASEAGGITQHIGAYHVQTTKGTITFLDTPGHAAFTAMRARGAKLTDIVVLVVAADDGVMPQTVEAIEHAKAANVPIVVAMNKIDKQDIDPDRVKTELSKHGLIPEEWGGESMFIPISAKTGMGIDTLLDSVLVQAEMLELKAPADCPASGVVIESRLDRGRGAVVSVLVQKGTLYKGDMVLAGLDYGRIRALFDEAGQPVDQAGPSIPVELLGLSAIPQAGDEFIVVADEKRAREVTAFRQNKQREAKFSRQAHKLEDLFQRLKEEKQNATTLNVILKADVQGSVEALCQALAELSNAEVKISIISSGIGGINESDVNLAVASNAILIAFNVRANTDARKLIEINNVDVHYHNIIYDVINLIKKAISGAMAPIIQERVVGMAQVREVFRSAKTGTIAGCMVTEGLVKRHYPIRILRDNVIIFEGVLESLRRFKDDASEVRAGMECGIVVKNYNDVKPGDQIEVFEKTQVKREG